MMTLLPTVGWRLPCSELVPPRGHLVVDIDVIADLGGLADHAAEPVVDDQPAAEPGAGMDFDAGEKTPHMRDEPAQSEEPVAPEKAREAVNHDRMQPRIAKQHFEVGPRGGIALPVGPHRLR